MKLHTETGSVYEVQEDRIRRTNPRFGKRADGQWVRLIDIRYKLGESALIVTEPLGEYGPDDYGTTSDEADPQSTRITSRIVEIEENE